MLLDILLGIIAGYVAPHAEDRVRRGVAAVTLADPPLAAVELRLVSFSLCLFVAAVIAKLVGEGDAVALSLGAVLGVFAPRLIDRWRGRTDDNP